MIDLLEHRTWYTLRAALLAHTGRFNTTMSKSQAQARLRAHLLDHGGLLRAFQQLTESEHAPLHALAAHGGRLPLRMFTRQFGEIRPYRPWRGEPCDHPWKQPISIPERLWFLGLIELTRTAVLLPDAVAALLPKPPPPLPVSTEPSAESAAAACLRDLAVLVGRWHADPPKLLHGRWLTPSWRRAWNQRCVLRDPHAGDLSPFAPGRLRVLHYVALVTGLIAGDQVSETGWRWLSAAEPFTLIMAAITRDLAAEDRLWDRFRLPALTSAQWAGLRRALADFQPGCTYALADLYARVKHQIAYVSFSSDIIDLLDWLGLIHLTPDRLCFNLPPPPSAKPAALTDCTPDQITIDLPTLPPLRPLAEVSAWAHLPERTRLIINSDAVANAVEQGQDTAAIARSVAALLGGPLPVSVLHCLSAWVREHSAVRLDSAVILTAAVPDDLRRVLADRRLRPLIRAVISDRHALVSPEHAAVLQARLQRRGQARRTRKHAPIPVMDPVRVALERAAADGAPVTIHYFSPTHDGESVRTIEPNLIYQRGDLTYVEAWCQREDDTRTFRLDRILAIGDG